MIGFIYQTPLEMPEKIRLSSLVIYGDEKMRKKVFLFLQKLLKKPDPQKKQKRVAEIRRKLFAAAEEAVAKIENLELLEMEKSFETEK